MEYISARCVFNATSFMSPMIDNEVEIEIHAQEIHINSFRSRSMSRCVRFKCDCTNSATIWTMTPNVRTLNEPKTMIIITQIENAIAAKWFCCQLLPSHDKCVHSLNSSLFERTHRKHFNLVKNNKPKWQEQSQWVTEEFNEINAHSTRHSVMLSKNLKWISLAFCRCWIRSQRQWFDSDEQKLHWRS